MEISTASGLGTLGTLISMYLVSMVTGMNNLKKASDSLIKKSIKFASNSI